MEIFLDVEFAYNFFLSTDLSSDIFFDFEKQFLRKPADGFKLIINVDNEEVLKEKCSENPILESFVKSCQVINYQPEWNNSLLEDSYELSTDPFKLFLVEYKTEDCFQLSKQYGYVFMSTHCIATFWKEFGRTHSVTNSDNVPDNLKFDSWDKIDLYSLPIHSILVVDRYVLDKKNDLELNIVHAIVFLIKTWGTKHKIKITILTEFKTFLIAPDSPEAPAKIKALVLKIESLIKSKVAQEADLELSIVNHNKNLYPNDFEALHDRALYTNNLMMECGAGFNLFKKVKGKIVPNHYTFVRMEFPFNRECWYRNKDALTHIAQYVNKVKNTPQTEYLAEKINYHTSKDNRLLKV